MVQENQACPLTRGDRILVAVDGSVYSEYAVDQAISMGSICNSEIFIVTVVDLYPDQMAVAPALTEKMSKEARDLLESAKAKVDKANIKCETIVHTGGQAHEFIIKDDFSKAYKSIKVFHFFDPEVCYRRKTFKKGSLFQPLRGDLVFLNFFFPEFFPDGCIFNFIL